MIRRQFESVIGHQIIKLPSGSFFSAVINNSMKAYKRLFTFGCSFTNYDWPTWANIIAYDMTDVSFYNYGASGLGNVAIQYLLLEADIVHTFNDDDLIIVNWTTWSREDRFCQARSGWLKGAGNVLNIQNRHYDQYMVEKYWSHENDIIKNASAIISSNRLFNISYQTSLTNPMGFLSDDLDESNAKTIYAQSLRELNISTFAQSFDEYPFDPHPSIIAHMEHVADSIYSTLGLTLSPQTIAYFDEYHKLIGAESEYDYATHCEHVREIMNPRWGDVTKRVKYNNV